MKLHLAYSGTSGSLAEHVFYDDFVYRVKRNVEKPYFPGQFKDICG